MPVDTSQTIKAVIWDLGGVLVRTHDHSGRKRWEQRLGLQDSELHRLVFKSEISRKTSIGQAMPSDIWAWISAQLDLSDSDVEQLKDDFWQGDEVDHELIDYIRALRPRRKTGLLSNAWPDLRGWIEGRWNIADAFDKIIISAEVGMVKPDPGIYHLALEALEVKPNQAVFIDDTIENVDGALALGMNAIHFKTPVSTREQLEALLSDHQ